MANLLERANRWLARHQERAVDECRAEVSELLQGRKALIVRMELLAKVSALVGHDLEQLLPKIAELSIPELADWSSVDLVGDGGARRIHIAHRDPGKRELAAELMRERPWPSQIAWPLLLEGRTLFFPRTTDEVLRANLDNDAHVSLARRIGVRSGITVPLRERDTTVAVMTFITTTESQRHYDYYDVVLAEELARRAAALIERARLLEELAEAVSFRDRMMAILGHDLRSPLSAIVASVGLLRQESSLVSAVVERVERIERAARRMSEMIGTLLDFSQARSGHRLPVSPGPADLAEVARTVIDELGTAHPDRTIELRVEGDARGLWDAARMGQVISNLVGNALAHAADDAVRVAILAGGGELTLRVHNYGPVIAPDLIPKLFEPFRRGPGEPAAPDGGLGLGLFIVKQIVLAHDGEVVVESTPAKGTTFIVRLPQRAVYEAHPGV